MSIEPKILAYVRTNVPLVNNRVEFVDAPQNTERPYITFAELAPGRVYSHGGFSDLSRQAWRFHVWADDYVTCREVSQELTDALESWIADGVNGCFLDSRVDMKDRYYHTSMTFLINYEE